MATRTNEEILSDQAHKLFSAVNTYQILEREPTCPHFDEKNIRDFCSAVQEAYHMKQSYEADPTAPLILAKMNYSFDEATFTHTVGPALAKLGPLLEFYLEYMKSGLERFLGMKLPE